MLLYTLPVQDYPLTLCEDTI